MSITKEQCRAARCYLDWSRLDLAQAAGVSPETIKNFEYGTFSPNYETEQAIITAVKAQGLEFVEGGVRKAPTCLKCGFPIADWLTVVDQAELDAHMAATRPPDTGAT